jgi:hypothetical protein
LSGIILVLLPFVFSILTGEAAELKKVKVAGAVGLEITPLMVAKEMGFYKEVGLDIEIVDLPSPRDQLPALASGQIDVLMAGNSAGFINMAVSGFGSKIACGYSHSSPKWYGTHINGILVRKDLYDKGEIKTIKDLKGRRVAFNAMIRTQTFDAAHVCRLRLEDVKIVEIAKFSTHRRTQVEGRAAFFIQPFGVSRQRRICRISSRLLRSAFQNPVHHALLFRKSPEKRPPKGSRFPCRHVQGRARISQGRKGKGRASKGSRYRLKVYTDAERPS